jgi:repressor of nif and glnA expression
MVNNLNGKDHRIIAILKVLSESAEPLGSNIVSRELERAGIKLSASSVRYLFRITDIRGYTQSLVHNGRMLTPHGLKELKSALVAEHLASSKEENSKETLKLQRRSQRNKI